MNKLVPSLIGKKILLMGSCGVLGRAHSFAIQKAGADLVLADRPGSSLIELAGELGCPYVFIDCTVEESVVSGISEAHDKIGEFDGAVYNAAITSEGLASISADPFPEFRRYPLDLWNQVILVNLTGAFLFSREVSKFFSIASSPSLVFVSSIYGVVAPDHSIYNGEAFNTFAGYSASKSGLLGLTRWLSTLFASKRIRVNALSPGGVFNGQPESFVKRYSLRTPLGRMAEPSDITGALLFLLSEQSEYMTGHNLIVDGGFTAW
jgi:NAD(P)-dependent dehydrogenase (short-subunit alcohol dehydrogenase family)